MAPITPDNLQAYTLEAIADIQEQLNRLEAFYRVAPLDYTAPHLIHTDPTTGEIFQRNAADNGSDFIGKANKMFFGVPQRGIQIEGLRLVRTSANTVGAYPGRVIYGNSNFEVTATAPAGSGFSINIRNRSDFARLLRRGEYKVAAGSNAFDPVITSGLVSGNIVQHGSAATPLNDGYYAVILAEDSNDDPKLVFDQRPTSSLGTGTSTGGYANPLTSLQLNSGETVRGLARLGYIIRFNGSILNFRQEGDMFYLLNEFITQLQVSDTGSVVSVIAPPECEVTFRGQAGIPDVSPLANVFGILVDGISAMTAERYTTSEHISPLQEFTTLTKTFAEAGASVNSASPGRFGAILMQKIGSGNYFNTSPTTFRVVKWRDLRLDSRSYIY